MKNHTKGYNEGIKRMNPMMTLLFFFSIVIFLHAYYFSFSLHYKITYCSVAFKGNEIMCTLFVVYVHCLIFSLIIILDLQLELIQIYFLSGLLSVVFAVTEI